MSEFPDLRTTASASGDKGRDGEVFVIDGEAQTAFQYSVAVDWRAKIADTVKKVRANLPAVRRLIMCSSQEIGAQGDDIKAAAWKEGLQVDIRDRNWFVERSATSVERATASEELSNQLADPLLHERGLVEVVATPLSREQNRVAMLQLAMNSTDRATERGLTKTSFESLVTAALVDTTADDSRSLADVQQTVRGFLPGAAAHQVDALTQSALTRLTVKRGPVKHRTDSDTYHMSFDDAQLWRASAAEYLLDQEEVEADLVAGAYGLNPKLDADFDALKAEASQLRRALEILLMNRGESFVHSVQGGEDIGASIDELAEVIGGLDLKLVLLPTEAARAISNVLEAPSDRTRNHLVRVLDAYTLFAFLQQTPDVQKTLARVFSGGEIWLDTSAILPLLGETLIADPSKRSLTNLLVATRESGIRLFVTSGVLEEVVSHLDNSLLYVRMAREWRGRIPFIYTAYMMSGRAESMLRDWISNFRGDEDPVLDVDEYLRHHFGIRRKDLLELSEKAPTDLRGAVHELWAERHRQRRERKGQESPNTYRLISHDVENVVGVIQHRRRTSDSPLGYNAWWLTLDSTAFSLGRWLKDNLGKDAPASPVLSPDYLSQILRLGPLRRQSTHGDSTLLPMSLSMRLFENVPPELIAIAKETREQYADFDELRIRREVRDALNRARRSRSDERNYSTTLESEILQAIAD